jgi:hypothetical protein
MTTQERRYWDSMLKHQLSLLRATRNCAVGQGWQFKTEEEKQQKIAEAEARLQYFQNLYQQLNAGA